MNDMRFIGGSLGLAEGKTIVLAMDRAINKKWPVLWMVQGGGARLQENIYSMMAIAEVTEAR
jgi:acetyl-CoA carboxylase beta subunit